MGILGWIRKRKKQSGTRGPNGEKTLSVDEEARALERTRKLRIEIEEYLKKEQDRRKSQKDTHTREK